jgi:hypothetical protein
MDHVGRQKFRLEHAADQGLTHLAAPNQSDMFFNVHVDFLHSRNDLEKMPLYQRTT